MTDWAAAERRADELKTQLDALETKLQRLAAENAETLRAEVKRLLEEFLAEHGLLRCRALWRAGVLVDPDNPRPPNGARCILPPHPQTTPCCFRLENGELWNPR